MECVGCSSGAVTERPDLTGRAIVGSGAGPATSSSTSAATVFSNVRRRTSAYLNNRLEQDHRGFKGCIRCMCGFKELEAADRFCREYDELRNFLHSRSRHNQTFRQPADAVTFSSTPASRWASCRSAGTVWVHPSDGAEPLPRRILCLDPSGSAGLRTASPPIPGGRSAWRRRIGVVTERLQGIGCSHRSP